MRLITAENLPRAVHLDLAGRYSDLDFSELVFVRCDFRDVQFDNCNFGNCHFVDCVFNSQTFARTSISSVRIIPTLPPPADGHDSLEKTLLRIDLPKHLDIALQLASNSQHSISKSSPRISPLKLCQFRRSLFGPKIEYWLVDAYLEDTKATPDSWQFLGEVRPGETRTFSEEVEYSEERILEHELNAGAKLTLGSVLGDFETGCKRSVTLKSNIRRKVQRSSKLEVNLPYHGENSTASLPMLIEYSTSQLYIKIQCTIIQLIRDKESNVLSYSLYVPQPRMAIRRIDHFPEGRTIVSQTGQFNVCCTS